MSGRKTSSYALSAEAQRRQQLTEQVNASRRQIASRMASISQLLDGLSAAARSHLARHVATADQWVATAKGLPATLPTAEAELSRQVTALSQILIEGGHAHDGLLQALRHREETARRVTADQRRLESELQVHRALLEAYGGSNAAGQAEAALGRAAGALREGDVDLADRQVAALLKSIPRLIGQAVQAEAAARTEAAGATLDVSRRRGQSVVQELTQLLAESSSGLQITYAATVAASEAWLRQWSELGAPTAAPRSQALDDLEASAEQVRSIAEAGEACRQSARQALVVEAGERQSRVAEGLGALQADWSAHRDQLYSWWLTPAQIESIDQRLAAVERAACAGQLPQAEVVLAALAGEMEAASQSTAELQARHERRMYVLYALEQACEQLNYEVKAGPRLARAHDRTSPIMIEISTRDRGDVTFALSLDALEAESGVFKADCHSTYTNLSERLREAFGVETEFRYEDDTPLEALLEVDEREEPNRAGLSRAQS